MVGETGRLPLTTRVGDGLLHQAEKRELSAGQFQLLGEEDLGLVAGGENLWVKVREGGPEALEELVAGGEGRGPELHALGGRVSHDPVTRVGRAAVLHQLDNQSDCVPVRRGHGEHTAGGGHSGL